MRGSHIRVPARTPKDEQLYRDALYAYGRESLQVFLRRFRRFATGLLASTAVVVLLLQGMPLHEWAKTPVGPAALVVWLGFLVMTACYGSMALGKWLLIKQR